MEATLLKSQAVSAKVMLRSGFGDPDCLVEALQIPMTKFRLARLWLRNNRHCGVCQQRWTTCELSQDNIKRLMRILKQISRELKHG
jgi:hypothetical protein